MKKVIISPPFSNIVPVFKNVDTIIGTYTLKKRKGRHRVLSTLKKTKKGWINNVGLRNPGIKSLKKKGTAISISIQETKDWSEIFEILENKTRKLKIKAIEFNISCPNAKVTNIDSKIINQARLLFDTIILKLPHNCDTNLIDQYIKLNVDYLHVSNTKKIQKGALSGQDLISSNLETIKYIKKNYDQKVIAGGGIYSFEDFIRYYEVEADAFSVSTLLLNPFKAYFLIKKMLQYLK